MLSPLPQIDLPPSPAIPPPPAPLIAFPPFVKTYETNPESLLPGVVGDLTSVALAWRIKQDISDSDERLHDPNLLGVHPPPSSSSSNAFDVLSVLKTTTRAIRSVRNYVVSLPDDSTGSIRANFRPSSLQPIPPLQKNRPTNNSETDPLTLIRRSALGVLTVLRQLEESSRVPLSDDAYDVQSEHGSGGSNSGGSSLGVGQVHSRVASPERENESEFYEDPSFAFSLVQVHGRDVSVPVWEDDMSASIFDDEEEQEKKEHWDARLVLGGGWLYRPDINIDSLGVEQATVARYLDVVDTVLFGGTRDGKRGWQRAVKVGEKGERGRRRVSTGETGGEGRNQVGRRAVSGGMVDLMKGMELTEEPEDVEEVGEVEGSIDDEELPNWAKRSTFADDELGKPSSPFCALTHILTV